MDEDESNGITDETRKRIYGLMLEAKGSKLKKITSYKRKRHEVSKSVLRSLNIRHGELCGKCNVNCAVKHAEDSDFWAIKDGLEPTYTIETCPKQSDLQRAKIKMKKRVK